jgi:SAM-dependent methyltransferase
MTMAESPPIDEAKLNELLGRVIGDFGGAAALAMGLIGDRAGLYRAMADAGPLTADALAARTGAQIRYVRPWLVNQAASGYVDYDAATDTYRLTPEQALAFADEESPASMLGGFQVILAAAKAAPRLVAAFRTGGGIAWGEHDPDLFEGTERFFKPGYAGNLVQSWLPALDGVVEKLERGAMVADVGCGHGASTIIMARAYPNSRFFGFDNHAASIEAARSAATRDGVADAVTFAVAGADQYPGAGYDLICFFDCLHDMGDPVAALRHARETLADDGTVLLVEPMAGETDAENINPVGRIFAAASVLVCTANAMATGGKGLGTLATEEALRALAIEAGFTRFRRATETPFNRVFEIRP